MKSNFTLSIPKPCHESWKDFKPTKRGGFCASCQKEVIDFTDWRDDEIRQHFMRMAVPTCGKFKPSQLKTYKSANEKPSASWRFAALLMLFSLWFGKPSLAQASKGKVAYSFIDEKRNAIAADTLILKITILGMVKDDAGEALPGVNIVRKGTTLGVVSDENGKFIMEIDKPMYNEVIVFSFIGMINEEVVVLANFPKKELSVTMRYDQSALNEVVIAGGVCAVGRFSPKRLWWKVRNVFWR